MSGTDWDSAYSESSALFGARPEAFLLRFLPPGSATLEVLDLGAGQGRNSLPLARAGQRVTAVDLSALALRELDATARGEGLALTTWVGRFEDFDAAAGSFDCVLALGLLQTLSRAGIERLVARAREWVAPGGLIFVSAFTTADPGYPKRGAEWTALGAGSFQKCDGAVWTYLEPGEGPRLFEGDELVHHWEGPGPEHQHGAGPVHRHGMLELVVRGAP